MSASTPAVRVHPITRAEYYALPDSPGRTELLDGVIYDLAPARAPHAGVITFLLARFHALDPTHFTLRSQDVLEINPVGLPEGAPEPDIAVLRFRETYYRDRHPDGADALLVIEVGYSERNPRPKMRSYMLDGRIPAGWRIDIPGRSIELWSPTLPDEPIAVLTEPLAAAVFEAVTVTVADVFAGIQAKPRIAPGS
jgi:Uma2 family endonuclease